MTQIIRTSDPRRFLTLAPQLAGGTPSDSALVLPFMGKRAWSAIRIDLPAGTCGSDCSVLEPQADCIDPHHATAIDWAVSITRTVKDLGADGLAVVVYPGCDLGIGALPFQTALEALMIDCEMNGLGVVTALVAGTDSWGDYRHPESARGPLAELDGIVEDGIDSVDPGRLLTGAEALPEAPSQEWCEEQTDLLSSLEDVTPVLFDDPVHAVGMALECATDELTDTHIAMLTTQVQRPVVRDEMLMTMIGGEGEGYRTRAAALEWNACGQSKRVEEEAALIMGMAGSPERARIRRALGLWTHVASRTVPEQEAAVYAVLGWLHWAIGTSSAADACVERALAGDPDHGFARIVASILDAGHVPCWVVDAFRDRRPQDAGQIV